MKKTYIIEVEVAGWFYYYGLNKDFIPEENLMTSSPQDMYDLLSVNIRGFKSKASAQRIIDEGTWFKGNADNIRIIELSIPEE